MLHSRPALRVAVVLLKAFAVGGVVFALGALAAATSEFIGHRYQNIVPWFGFCMLGLAAAAVLYLLSEAGVILLDLEEQSALLQEKIEELQKGASAGSEEEKD